MKVYHYFLIISVYYL